MVCTGHTHRSAETARGVQQEKSYLKQRVRFWLNWQLCKQGAACPAAAEMTRQKSNSFGGANGCNFAAFSRPALSMWAVEPALSSLRQDCDINSTELHSAGKQPWCREEAKTDTLQGFATQPWASSSTHLLCFYGFLPQAVGGLFYEGKKVARQIPGATLCPPEAGKGLQACL